MGCRGSFYCLFAFFEQAEVLPKNLGSLGAEFANTDEALTLVSRRFAAGTSPASPSLRTVPGWLLQHPTRPNWGQADLLAASEALGLQIHCGRLLVALKLLCGV